MIETNWRALANSDDGTNLLPSWIHVALRGVPRDQLDCKPITLTREHAA